MFKKLISVVIAVMMVVSLVPAVFAAKPTDFPDMPKKGFWSYDALCAAIENGLLNGSGGKLLPGSKLTRAEMAAIVNRAFGAIATDDVSGFKDVKESDWFYNDIAKALRMGTFVGSGGGKMNPRDPILREQAFTVVARALKLEDGDPSVLGKFSDAGKISGWAKGPVAAMVAAGYVNGSGGKLNPRATITRQEFAQVFYNVIKKYVKTAGEVSEDVTGNLIVNVPGVTLKNMKVTGDLIVGEGVDNGEVTLSGVEVTGRLLVRGGGENSVIITNNSTVGSVLIGKTGDGGVRVRTEEGCRVEAVVVDDGRDEIILEGGMNQIVINTDTPVIIRNGDVVGLTVAAENANVTVGSGVSVMSATISGGADGAVLSVDETAGIDYLKSEAEGADIKGDGKIELATVSGNGTKYDVVGTTLTLADGTTGVVECGKPVAGGETVITGMEDHVHDWGDGAVTKEATCTEDGVRTFTCKCGETKTEAIPAKGHSPAAAVRENEAAPTCTETGKYDEVVYCSVCSAELSRKTNTTDALGHDWDDGVTVIEATYEAEGLIRYTCSRCKETRDEVVPVIGHEHVWDEGVETKEATFFEPGEITYTCQGCGATRKEEIPVLPPYAVFAETEPLLFDTLEEAIAEASKHPYHNDPGEDEWTEYSILLLGPDKRENLVLESGYNLIVYGRLEVEGEITLGASDYAHCPGAGAARLIVSMEEGVFFSVGGRIVFDGDAPENGSFRMLSDNTEGSGRLTITGYREIEKREDPDDATVYEKPFLCLEGNPADYDSVEIIGDADFTSWTDGFVIEDNFDEVRLAGALAVDNIETWDTPLDFCGENASFTVGGVKYIGTSSDASFQMIDDGGAEIWASVEGDGSVHFTGREARFNGDFDFDGRLDFAPPRDSEDEFLVTVGEEADVTLGGEVILNEGVRFVNDGNFTALRCYLGVDGVFENNGTFETTPVLSDDGHYVISEIEFRGGSSFVNRGRFIIGGFDTEDGYRFSEFSVVDGEALNEEGGRIENSGSFCVEGGSFVNDGLIITDNEFQLRSGMARITVIAGEDGGGTEENPGYLESVNNGTVINRGFFNVSGSSLVNGGRFENDGGRFYVHSQGAFTQVETIERVPGQPENGEDWDNFWGWDHERDGWFRSVDWRYEADEIDRSVFTNSGTFMNFSDTEFSGASVSNTGSIGSSDRIVFREMSMENYDNDYEHIRFPESIEFPISEVFNSGRFVNGTTTGVGEGWDGSDGYVELNRSTFENSGEIVNNGRFELRGADYSQAAGSKLVTYNSSGLEITGGSIIVPADSEFLNEGYLRITDEFGENAEFGKCDLSGFENFFTDWVDESNESRWLDYSVNVYDMTGYEAAVAEQSERDGRYKYNRLDFRGDITFTEDEVLDDFDNYWIESAAAFGWFERTDDGDVLVDEPTENSEWRSYNKGVTVTVAEGATVTVGNDTTLIVNGDDWDEWRITFPGTLKVDGTFVVAKAIEEIINEEGERISDWFGEGRVEVWMDGSVDASAGEIVNNGYFEVRYHERCRRDGDVYINEGGFFRPEETVLSGLPDNYIPCAEVRTSEGFAQALTWEDPVFLRICPRYDSCVTVRDDLTLREGAQLSIEGNSGMNVEYGATFTVSPGAYVDNHGDVTVWGDLIVEGSFWSERNIEVGAVTGSEEAHIVVRGNGSLETWARTSVVVYGTGEVILEDAGHIMCEGAPVRVAVKNGWRPEGRIGGIILPDGVVINVGGEYVGFDERNTVFEGDSTVNFSGDPNGGASVIAGEGATVTVNGMVLEQLEDGMRGNNFNVLADDEWFFITPHVFGLGDNPSVFVGMCDDRIGYKLFCDGKELEFDLELIPEENKTHLSCKDGCEWFEAYEGHDPGLTLEITLPGGVTVIINGVPLKPEWDEVRPD